jgi:hypothetical protein
MASNDPITGYFYILIAEESKETRERKTLLSFRAQFDRNFLQSPKPKDILLCNNGHLSNRVLAGRQPLLQNRGKHQVPQAIGDETKMSNWPEVIE